MKIDKIIKFLKKPRGRTQPQIILFTMMFLLGGVIGETVEAQSTCACVVNENNPALKDNKTLTRYSFLCYASHSLESNLEVLEEGILPAEEVQKKFISLLKKHHYDECIKIGNNLITIKK